MGSEDQRWFARLSSAMLMPYFNDTPAKESCEVTWVAVKPRRNREQFSHLMNQDDLLVSSRLSYYHIRTWNGGRIYQGGDIEDPRQLRPSNTSAIAESRGQVRAPQRMMTATRYNARWTVRLDTHVPRCVCEYTKAAA